MTLKELKNRALIKADEVANAELYEDIIIDAINSVGDKIVAFARPRVKYIEVESNNKRITMPSDMIVLNEVQNMDGNIVRYRKIDNRTIEVSTDGLYRLNYNAIFPNITKETEDNEVIDIEEVCEDCLITGVASVIAIDDIEKYDILANEYNNLLANLSQLDEPVQDLNNQKVSRVGGWYW